MKKLSVLIALVAFVSIALLLAQKTEVSFEKRWKTVQELADKQLPESALKEVETILAKAEQERNSSQVIKAMVHKMRFTLMKNPDSAPTLIREFEWFTEKRTDPAEKALLCSMTAELYVQYYLKDQWKINQRTEIKGTVSKDMNEWTKNIYFDKITNLLAASLRDRSVLQQTNVQKYNALWIEGSDSPNMQPTLFDLLSYRSIEILQKINQTTTLKNPLNNAALFDLSKLSMIKPDTAYQHSIENHIVETYQRLLDFRAKEKGAWAIIYADLHYLRYLKDQTTLANADSLYVSSLQTLNEQYKDNEVVVEVIGELANYYFSRSYNTPSFKKTAYDLCSEGINRFPNYRRIEMLKNIKQAIANKSISIQFNRVAKRNTTLQIQVTSANIPTLQLTIYKVNATALQYLNDVRQKAYRRSLYSKITQVETKKVAVKQDPNFGSVNTTIEIETGDYGIYEVCVEEPGNLKASERVFGAFTVSDLAFMRRTNQSSRTLVYVLDRATGKPVSGVKVSLYDDNWGRRIDKSISELTNKNGLCDLPYSTHQTRCTLSFEKGNDCYYISDSDTYYNWSNRDENRPVKISIFTDRSLYRPGQTLFFKGIETWVTTTRHEVVAGKEFKVTLYDANKKIVASKAYRTNEFGSIAGEFVLPEGGLNGMFQLKIGDSYQSIKVEEYKRPTFEAGLQSPNAEVSFGEKVTVKGTVKAYAGYNIADAHVKYRVVRNTHRHFWWLRDTYKEVGYGTTTSASDGAFEISFTPEKEKSEAFDFRNEQYYTYTVYADVTDQKGETQQAQQYFSVGERSLFIVAQIAQEIDKNRPFNIDVSTETLNGKEVNSIVKYSLYQLANSDEFAEKLTDKSKLKELKKVLSGSFDTSNKKLNLKVDNLPSGRYKIVFTANDAHGMEVKHDEVFVLYDVNDKRPPVKSYVWLLTPKTVCLVGEKAQINFGTSTKHTSVLYEVMKGTEILKSNWVSLSDEVKRFEIPYKESYGAGVTVMFTFMKDGELYTKQVKITRQEEDKKLTPGLSVFRNKLLPGEKAEWTISVPECGKAKRTAEVLVGMYDASLDALQSHYWVFQPFGDKPDLYSPVWRSSVYHFVNDNVTFNNHWDDVIEFNFNHLNWFGLQPDDNHQIIITHSAIRGASSIWKDEEVSEFELNEEKVVGYGTQKKMLMTGSVAKSNQGDASTQPAKVRTNFNETAFFYPQLRTDSAGNVKFTFTAPESLTRWNVKMLAHTTDLFFGQSTEQVVTQKDLMVQMNLPRFVRRSDKLTLSANVVNLTDKELTATVRFELIDPATEKSIVLKDASPKTVTLQANETKAIECQLTEFTPYELVICKVVAQAGNFSDGEQRYLPVLPDKVLVTESMPLTIRGNQTRMFNFGNLSKNVSTVDTRNLSVEFSSNPTWYAVQALPTISKPENENALDYFTAYYANSLASFIANSNPRIAATFDQWKKAGGSREALLSNLEKNKELKNMMLEETPWVTAAQDETEQKRQIGLLFDLNMQKNQAQQYLDKLTSLQNPSGAFSWFKGMGESRYITQEIMLHLARLNKMTGVATDEKQQKLTNSALDYLDSKIKQDFDDLKMHNKEYSSKMVIDNMQLFYLHLRSEYPTIPINKAAEEAVKFYTAQSEKYWTNLTLYGKAMMAVVAYRNGNRQLANDILKSLKENAMKTDELGMYWATNRAGYFWNERPIAVQAAIIEAFAEVTKNVADVEEMKIWLLKQKQTQRWDSPMSTVNAIYSLLHCGDDWLSNSGSVHITVGDRELQTASREAATGYIKERIPTTTITPAMGRVTVSKPNKGIGWGAMYWQYYQELGKVTDQGGALNVTKKLFVEKMTSTGKTMLPIGHVELKRGDKVITRLVITTDRDLEFVALKDLRAACFEPVEQLSSCKWKEGVCYYQTTKDASTQFFFSFLPKGTYVFEYEFWVSNSGEFSSGMATIQCQYAPEFISHSRGERITIKN